MTKQEIKTILLLAGIYTSRMLGLFLIFPSFSLLAKDFAHATPTKIGLALGIYSLVQATLQIPAGWLSDIIGRKKVLYIGLTLFFCGSVLASLTNDLHWLIVARCLQGMGAVSAVCLAYVGDSIRGSEQSKAMMIIGISIGASFMLALIVGSVISAHWGLVGIFRVTALLALCALWFAYLLPTPAQTLTTFNGKQFARTLLNKALFAVNIQVALLHMNLSACFFLIPLLLSERYYDNIHVIYIIPLVITAGVVGPLVRNRDQGVARLPYFWSVFALSLVILASFAVFASPVTLALTMTIFFCGFTLVETLLPARLLMVAKDNARGTSSGIFSLYQMGGSFLGGLLGAKCYTIFATSGTIQSGFYVLAAPAIAVAASLFMNKQIINKQKLGEKYYG